MKEKEEAKKCEGWEQKKKWHHGHATPSSAVYGLGLIGALVYYISTASGFWVGVLGVLKSLVWPVFAVYELLKFLGA